MARRKPSITSLKRKLDKIFSLYIRRRDAPADGFGRCVTCRKWARLQCGHFVIRQHQAGRWDEHNAHGQCYYCNHRLHGAQVEHYEAIIRKYGLEEGKRVRRLQHTTLKLTRADYEELIRRFTSIC